MHLFSRMGRRASLVLAAGLMVAASGWAQSGTTVKFQTSVGDFVVEVYPDKAPKTAENFLQYVRDRHYNGTVFHRVIDGFMVQGGGFGTDMKEKSTRAPIPLEATNGLKNDRGTIAMARTGNPNSATAQFFVNVVNNDGLNAPKPDGYGYAVFGKVVSGMDVIDKIRATPVTNKGMFQNTPVTPIVITSANLVK